MNVFVKHFINNKDQGKAREISIPETLEYAIEQSGKHTFSFFEHDPENYDYDPNDIESDESNMPIWEQDVFVIKHDACRLPKDRVEK